METNKIGTDNLLEAMLMEQTEKQQQKQEPVFGTGIIGQEELIKDVVRIFQIFQSSEGAIRPHFILTGESGSTKTFAVKTIANEMKMGFLEINAAQLTKEGVSGNSLSKAMAPMLQMTNKPTVVFVDEFDKLFISGNSNDSAAHESTTGVQNEFLKVLESDTASVFGDYGKYVQVPMTNTIFVFAGAFNGEKEIDLDRLRDMGVKTEFLGRVGLVFNTKKLTVQDMKDILASSALLDKYCLLFKKNKQEVIDVLESHIEEKYEMNTLGARMVNTAINQYFIKGGLVKSDSKKISFSKNLEF